MIDYVYKPQVKLRIFNWYNLQTQLFIVRTGFFLPISLKICEELMCSVLKSNIYLGD